MLAVQRISSYNHTHFIHGGCWDHTIYENHLAVRQSPKLETFGQLFTQLFCSFLLLVIKICQAICKEVHCTYLTLTQKETHKYKNQRPFCSM